jgi:predicted nucleic acid-binding protein
LVIFWDTSAVLRLLINEQQSEAARQLLKQAPAMLVWWATPIECLAAVARSERDGRLSGREAEQHREALGALAAAWSEVLAGERVREHAARLILRHPLRAADALQLAAALTWAEARPRRHVFASFDLRLAEAARREGFRLALPGPDG